jgi:hypothetical protein
MPFFGGFAIPEEGGCPKMDESVPSRGLDGKVLFRLTPA